MSKRLTVRRTMYYSNLQAVVDVTIQRAAGFFWDMMVEFSNEGERFCHPFPNAFSDFLFSCIKYNGEQLLHVIAQEVCMQVHIEWQHGARGEGLAKVAFESAKRRLEAVKETADMSKMKELQPETNPFLDPPVEPFQPTPMYLHPQQERDLRAGAAEVSSWLDELKPEEIAESYDKVRAADQIFAPEKDKPVKVRLLMHEKGYTYSVPCKGDDECPACAIAKKIDLEDKKIWVPTTEEGQSFQNAQVAMETMSRALNDLAEQMTKRLQPVFTALVKAFNTFAETAVKEFALIHGAEQNTHEEMWKAARDCPNCEAKLPKELVEKIEAGTVDCPHCHWSKSRCAYDLELLVRDHWQGGHKCPRCGTRYDDEKNEY